MVRMACSSSSASARSSRPERWTPLAVPMDHAVERSRVTWRVAAVSASSISVASGSKRAAASATSRFTVVKEAVWMRWASTNAAAS